MFESFFYFPEEIGQDTLNQVDLLGYAFDIHGQPVDLSVKIRLNKPETSYKNQFNLSGAELRATPDDISGLWGFLLPDNFHMPLDSYYRIEINGRVFRKFLPDFPPENSLNLLEDY
jgi:hypothetical protein